LENLGSPPESPDIDIWRLQSDQVSKKLSYGNFGGEYYNVFLCNYF